MAEPVETPQSQPQRPNTPEAPPIPPDNQDPGRHIRTPPPVKATSESLQAREEKQQNLNDYEARRHGGVNALNSNRPRILLEVLTRKIDRILAERPLAFL